MALLKVIQSTALMVTQFESNKESIEDILHSMSCINPMFMTQIVSNYKYFENNISITNSQ